MSELSRDLPRIAVTTGDLTGVSPDIRALTDIDGFGFGRLDGRCGIAVHQ
jgi:hypothetical protein